MAHTIREKTKLLNRVRRIRGQIEAVERALEAEKSCAEVMHLVAAARGAMNGFMAEIVEDHIRFHVSDPANDPDRGRAYFKQLMDSCSTMMQAIVRLPKPVIACVQGPASAAGCQLVASCDLAVASSTAKFATPGVNIGLFCSTPMVALSRNVARKVAMEMLLTGDLIAAEDAQRIGLVNRVVPAGTERDAALALARQIASKSALTVKIGKEAFYRQLEMSLADAYRYASDVMVENMLARDAEEGIGAFIEKRTASWEDR